MSSAAINFAELAETLLSRGRSLLEQWLPDGVVRGHEYVCASLAGGKGTSCSINLTNGRWKDFQTGEAGGDLLSLYQAVFNHSTAALAAVAAAHEYGLESVGNIKAPRPGSAPAPRALPPPAPPPVDARAKWQVICPVPEAAPPFNFSHYHRQSDAVEHIACYAKDSVLYGYVVRVKRSGGGKDVLPYTWCAEAETGALKWCNKQASAPRALYLPDGRSPAARTVILVEGEKKADALHELLQAANPDVYCIASWPGGCKAWEKADWSWLAGCTVLAWADCDAKHEPLPREQAKGMDEVARALAQSLMPLLPEAKQPGMAAMLAIGAHLRDAQGCTVSLLPIPAPGAVADGWDCADAIAEGWDAARVVELLGRAQTLPSAALATGASNVVRLHVVAASGGGDGPASAAAAGSGGGDGGGSDRFPPWLMPYFDFDKGRWRKIGRKLVIAALQEDALLSGIVAFNELSNNIDVLKEWPWADSKIGPLGNGVDLLLGEFLSRHYGLPEMPRQAIFEAIETVALKNRYHPVRNYLRGLQHDTKPRIDSWLQFALGYQKESTALALWEYLSIVGRCWLVGMVARVMEPGCKFDYMPVLEGKGGMGKSTMLEILAGNSTWFSATHFDITKIEKGNEQIQGLWLYEFGELASFGMADVRLIKSFITNKTDRYRPAYARVIEAFPRQCVLTGSTNDKQYLRDRTGNRRFWPIACIGMINNQWLAERRDQLFAEALALYEAGVAYHPSPDEELRLFLPQQEERMVQSVVHGELDRLTKRGGSEQNEGMISKGITVLTEFITVGMVARAMGSDASKVSNILANEIRAWFEEHAWTYCKRTVEGARVNGYAQPTVWPPKSDDVDSTRSVGQSVDLPNQPINGDDDEPF